MCFYLHIFISFAGGGVNWQLVMATDTTSEFWISRWDVTNHNANDNRIWGVTYGCVQKNNHGSTVPQPDLNVAISRLTSALTAARDFADTNELPSWSEWFQRAIDCTDPSKSITFPDRAGAAPCVR